MLKRTSAPPTIGTTNPRNDFGPAQVRACLDFLSQREIARTDRLSSITRLRGDRR